MSDSKIDLTEKDFSFVCPMKESDMDIVDGGYFCGKCKEKVHDVSDMTKSEFQSLLKTTEDICVSFKKSITMTMALSIAASATIPPKYTMGKVIIRDRNTTKVETKDVFSKDKNISEKLKINIEKSSCQTLKK